MNELVETLRDLRRRRVFRGIGVYLLGAWSVVQVADVLADPAGLPAWTIDALLILALAGFPLAVWMAWRYQWTERGLVRSGSGGDAEADTPLRLGAVDYFVIAGLAVIAAYFAVNAVDARRSAADTELASDGPIVEGPDPKDLPANAVAVLPFEYLSAEADGAFLADGVSDTVLHVLSRVPELRVTARTSSFAFRDQALTATEIALALGVANVLEGSVQRVGDQVRVIARLVDARSDSEVWSGRFDRQTSEIFAIQDEIARNVAAALQANLTERSEAALASRYEPPLEAYERYLEGRKLLEDGLVETLPAALSAMQAAVDLDPDYALAWIGLFDAERLRTASRPGSFGPELLARLEEIVEHALELDPLLAEAWVARSAVFAFNKDFDDAKEALRRALELNTNLPRAHAARANALLFDGDREGHLEAIRRAVELDPENLAYREQEAQALWALSRAEQAMAQVRALLREHPERPSNYLLLARWLTQLGRAGEGLRYMLAAQELDPENQYLVKIICEQYLQFWDVQGARDCFSEYVAANPADLDAQRWLRYHAAPPLADLEARLDEVIEIAERDVASHPDRWYTKAQLSQFLLLRGDDERVIELLGGTFPEMLTSEPQLTALTQWPARMLGEALWRTGRHEDARPLLEGVLTHVEQTRKLQGDGWIAGVEDAQVLCVLGERERCLDALASTVDAGWLFYSHGIERTSAFASVRGNPRFEAIMERLAAHARAERDHFYEHRDQPVI